MTHYLIKFVFYTAGVIGFLLIAYIVAKNSLSGGVAFKKKPGNLEIEETLAISPRKTLHIVKAFDEKFLIASDQNSTTLLAKLNSEGEITATAIKGNFDDFLEEKNIDNTDKNISKNNKDTSVIQSMLKKLK